VKESERVRMAAGYGRKPGNQMGWLRHVLTLLSVLIFLLGCIVIGYMAWVLATSVTVARFVDGGMFWTYSVISIGFSLFFSGLVGWVGGASESACLIRLFLLLVLISMIAELGGIITLNVLGQGLAEVLEQAWSEVNQGTRNIVQTALTCCGWRGLDEFANNEPIAESCYERITPNVSGILSSSISLDFHGRLEAESQAGATRRMKQEACRGHLHAWFQDNKIIWVTVLASIAAIQVMCIGIAVYILKRVSSMRAARAASKRKLYDSSEEETVDERRYMGRI